MGTNDRNKLIDRVDALYDYVSDTSSDGEEQAWAILKRYGADELEHDPAEGFFGTMSDDDLRLAANALEAKFFGKAVNVRLREKEVELLVDALSHVSSSGGSDAKMIQLLVDKLSS